MLTPRDIEKKSFSHTRNNGYKTEEVEDFLEEIIADYSMLIEERENLSNRVLSLSDKLENIRDEQEVWKKTLMNTQKSYDEIIDSAKEKADAIIKEATAKAESITSAAAAEAIDIKSKINDLTAHKNALAAEVERFKDGLLASYEAHIKIIQTIPTISKEELAKTVDIEIPHISAVEKNISDATEHNDADADAGTEPAEQEEDVKQEETKPLDATMVVPPIKAQETEEETVTVTHTRLRQPIEADQADDDDDILVSRSARPSRPRTEPVRQNNKEISSREEKLRNLFADEPAEKQKPKKTKRKLSRFFVDDDEIDDEDFDDED